MWPDRVSNPGPPTYESGALPIALRGPALDLRTSGESTLQFHRMRVPDLEIRSNSHFLSYFFDRLVTEIKTFYCTVSVYLKATVKHIIRPLP